MTLSAVPPLLVFAWGNRSRGDDALGPLFLEQLRAAHPQRADVEYLEDYQLQIEHALDLLGRERVLLVDASRNCPPPFAASALQPRREAAFTPYAFTTHSLSPQDLLQVFHNLHGEPPPCTLLAIRGEQFALGAAPTAPALAHLAAALHWAHGWLAAAPLSSPPPHA